MSKVGKKGDRQGLRDRRDNLRIDGIKDGQNETWVDMERLCLEVFQTKLGLSGIRNERACHTGARRSTRPCTTVVKFMSFKDCQLVFTRAKERKLPDIFINADYSQRISGFRRDMRSELQVLKARGAPAYISCNRIKIGDQRHGQRAVRNVTGGQLDPSIPLMGETVAEISLLLLNRLPLGQITCWLMITKVQLNCLFLLLLMQLEV